MTFKSICSVLSGATVLILSAGAAHAAQYQWDWDHLSDHNDGGGVINDAQAVFNTATKRFAFNANFDNVPNSQAKTQGFWLVVSPGPNPKGTTGELAIFYMDASKIDGINNKNATLSVYAYNGVNADTSFKDGTGHGDAPDRIVNSIATQSWVNSLTMVQNQNGSRTFSFDIDATAIQGHTPLYPGPGGAADWTGCSFGQNIGVWFHPVAGLSTDYRTDGFLKKFDYSKSGWLDGENFKTTPEPISMIALGAGVATMLRRRKKG